MTSANVDIRISITGLVGSGKTTVAYLIQRALRDAGIAVVDMPECYAWHGDGRALHAVAERGAQVEIVENTQRQVEIPAECHAWTSCIVYLPEWSLDTAWDENDVAITVTEMRQRTTAPAGSSCKAYGMWRTEERQDDAALIAWIKENFETLSHSGGRRLQVNIVRAADIADPCA